MTTTNATDILSLVYPLLQWRPATWDDFIAICDSDYPDLAPIKVFFDEGDIFVEMGQDGINHGLFTNIFPMLFFLWFTRISGQQQAFRSFGPCVIEKPNKGAACPDIVLYIGENIPAWKKGEPRRINLNNWRVPDLVGEVADTTLANDLARKKLLFAALKIPEYWVADVMGKRVLAFRLQEDGTYQQCEYSTALEGLPIALLNETLERLTEGDHASVAVWFSERIANLNPLT